jgi:ABC-type sugar transport system ATPase subunit
MSILPDAPIDRQAVPPDGAGTLLEMRGIKKAFSGNIVLKGIDFTVHAGEVHALLGENGAGKSTLMKILMGVYSCDAGQVLLEGNDITARSVRQHLNSGIAMVFQELSLLPNCTVAENLLLEREPLRGGWRVDARALVRQARELIERYGFDLRASTRLRQLGFAQRQMVEILKNISRGARVLILDEPTSSLSVREEEKLFSILGDLRARGMGIIYISHRLAEIFRLADRISIVKDGGLIGPLRSSETNYERLAQLMSKSSEQAVAGQAELPGPAAEGGTALSVQNLSTGQKLRKVSFSILPGEVVGLAGLVGSGRSTLAKAIFGLLKDAEGEIQVGGRPVKPGHPRTAIRAGIGFVPEDRRLEGLILGHSLRENLALPSLDRLVSGKIPLVSWQKIRRLFAKFQQRLAIKCRNGDQKASELSGGNQQKIVFAKWLATHPKILILDEPTAGVDIQTKVEMRQIIRQIAREGVAVLLISSELDEVVATADRILLMIDGQIGESQRHFETEAELRGALQLAIRQNRQLHQEAGAA